MSQFVVLEANVLNPKGNIQAGEDCKRKFYIEKRTRQGKIVVAKEGFSNMQTIDLSHTIEYGMPIYPGDPAPSIDHELTHEQDYILGTMLGYDISIQCKRYLDRTETAEEIRIVPVA